jgi:N-acetylmuramoyl-L-alanine amidase
MKHATAIVCFALVAMVVTLVGARASDLQGVRFGPDKGKTRIVFDVSGAPVYAISGDDLGQGRLIIDFNELSVPRSTLAPQRGKGHVASYQFMKRADGGVRAVMSFKSTAKIKESFVIEPSPGVAKHRLVIDLLSADKSAFLASLPSQYPDLGAVIERATADTEEFVAPSSRQKEVKAVPAEKRVIVVDAGHGGADPGAQGQSGTLEKHVNLKAALKLREILEKTGRYKVVLTRVSDNDPNILRSQRAELARREKLARDAGADLFISLHADALAQKAIRGGSVYTLSQEGSERSARLAKEQGNYTVYQLDASEFQQDQYVGDILFDIAQNATNTASSRFAEKLLGELNGVTPLLDKSHRTADFRVLLAPDVPAVLLEMAFISNAKDEANLNSAAWRARTMAAVAKAIDGYFAEYDARRFAQNRTPETN